MRGIPVNSIGLPVLLTIAAGCAAGLVILAALATLARRATYVTLEGYARRVVILEPPVAKITNAKKGRYVARTACAMRVDIQMSPVVRAISAGKGSSAG